MSAAVVVGYTATDTGADALALGIRLARAIGAPLEIALVLPGDARSVITPPDAAYTRHIREQAESWLNDAARRIPDAVPHRTRIRHADSFAEGLVAFADEIGAGYIVVGAANGGLRGRHRLGTVASELLHSSDVPVVLAPEGSRLIDPALGISRVTAAIGSRPGADVLRDESVQLAAAASVPLRLLSLVTVDLPAGLETGAIRIAGAAHSEEVLAQARAELPADIAVEATVADGDSIEEAVRDLAWDPAELAIVGSSRLAQPRRLFLGSTAAKMLHELPVPLVVVPRSRADVPVQEGPRP
ncbi:MULTISPECIES: universal stress protein [Microbacterium]|uniref:universal stress protein n=1 Tax=Microbacterium TaxID=33882 RepID=UPI002787DC1F|nr:MULTISPECIES: universal stress protein [Microbacterium]MDQ1075950.1 nucleotide-binding universal stress UspA family protein [Microbacterium sp. SORGH_AS_0969]MDQ1116193.1 nucleotide-binding universal stress UspA family protein [Microbacterium testaceum]